LPVLVVPDNMAVPQFLGCRWEADGSDVVFQISATAGGGVLRADLFGGFIERANFLPEHSDQDAATKTAAEPSPPAVEVTGARKN
jgi:hypothetical protein